MISSCSFESSIFRSIIISLSLLNDKYRSSIPFDIPYGGFGTILNKAAITLLSTPIHCSSGIFSNIFHNKVTNQAVCNQIKSKTNIGEGSIFKNGMTLFELFYRYSSVQNYCFHSDWLMGYILEYYVKPSDSIHKNEKIQAEESPSQSVMVAVETYPACGNITVETSTPRYCTPESPTCHNLEPHNMEHFAMHSYVRNRNEYDNAPVLSTSEDWKMKDILESVERMEREMVPTRVQVSRWVVFTLTPIQKTNSSFHVMATLFRYRM